MKQTFLTFILMLLPMIASADPVEIDGIWYNIIIKGSIAEVTNKPSGQYYSGTVSIPDKVKYNNVDYPVTKIGDNAFFSCEKLISVIIPNSVTSIGNSAFFKCKGLESLNIPNSVTSLGQNVFQLCISLTSVIIPNSLEEISYDAFAGCSGLQSVSIPNSIKTIAIGAFSECINLTNIDLPTSVTTIGGLAFQGCTGLSSIHIPENVKELVTYAFKDCTKLTTVSISSSVNKIGTKVFQNCPNLTDIYCKNPQVSENIYGGDKLYTSPDAFDDSYPEYITLHVPAISIEAYRALEPWNKFKEIVALTDEDLPVLPKCATPIITFANGIIDFACETADVEFVSNITNEDVKSYYDSSITLSQKYLITVYATKKDYEASDIATREIVITGNGKAIVVGDVDGDGKVNVADHVELSKIIMGQ